MPVPQELTFCLYEIEILSSLLHLQLIFAGIPCDTDSITSLCFARNNQLGQTVFQISLDGTLQRTGSELYVVAFLSQEFLGFVVHVKVVSNGFLPFVESLQLNVYDACDGIERQLVESYNLVKTVQELGREGFVQRLLNNAT